MGIKVDDYTAKTIMQYIKTVQNARGKPSTKGHQFGWGTVHEVEKRLIAIAKAEGYTFYKQNKLSGNAFRQRVVTYAQGHRVFSQSYDDARWIASMIKKYRLAEVPTPEPAQVQITVSDNSIDNLLTLAKYLRAYPAHDDDELFAITTTTEVQVLRLLVDRLEN